jgi:hypothetical protein
MQNVRSGTHLELIGETWYYRRVVPPDARDVFGKTVVRFSLKTKSHTEARRLEKTHDVEFESRLRARVKQDPTDIRETPPPGSPNSSTRYSMRTMASRVICREHLPRSLSLTGKRLAI